MVDDKRVRELVKEIKMLAKKYYYLEPQYELFWSNVVEALGDNVEDIIKYFNEIEVELVDYLTCIFDDIYGKFMTDYVWDELEKLEKKIDEYNKKGVVKKKKKKLLDDTKKLIKKVDKVCKSGKDFEKPIYHELLQKIEDKFNDEYLEYGDIDRFLNKFSVDVLKKLKPLLEKMSAEGWECVRYSLERIEEDAK